MKLKISIAMATYNGADYLAEQLQSLRDQTRLPDELVVTDDGSTDSTPEIVKAFSESAPFDVHYFRNDNNLGYAGNFNKALMETTGELVFPCDQDDVWFPEKIAHMERLADQHPDMLVLMNDAALTDGKLNEVGLTKWGQIQSMGLGEKEFVMGCCCAVRRDLLNICMPIPVGVQGHDNWIAAFADGLNAKLVNGEVLQYYRRHERNESQVVANRTTRITWKDRYSAILISALRPDSEKAAAARVSQLQLIIEGIGRAQSRSPGLYHGALETMKQQTMALLDSIQQRMEIRSHSLPVRLVAVINHWVAGGYRQASGVRSAVRDVLGR